MGKQNKFNKWFSDNFKRPYELAAKLHVGDATVRLWLNGKACPKHTTLLKIVELSKGKLTCEDVIRCTTSNTKKD